MANKAHATEGTFQIKSNAGLGRVRLTKPSLLQYIVTELRA